MNNKRKGNIFFSLKDFLSKHMTTTLTIVMVWCSVLLYNANKGNFEIEKTKQTISLSKDFFDWFIFNTDGIAANISLQNLKMWEGSLQDTVLRNNWLNLSDVEQIKELNNNPNVAKLFNFFEDAKILHQKGLLDVEYFINFFYNSIRKLEKTSNPTLDTFIETKRIQNNNPFIYDGYYYCRDEILNLYGNERQKISVEYVKQHKKITVSKYMEINNTSLKRSERELKNMVKRRIFKEVTENNQIFFVLL